MRLIKMFGLAAIAAVAAMAFIGATSASALNTQLCNSHTALTCAAGQGSTGVTMTNADHGSGILLNSLANIFCLDISGTGTPLALANPQSIHILSLEFNECGTNTDHTNCEITVTELPLANLNKTGLDAGTLTGVNGKTFIFCENVFFSTDIECEYDATGLQFSVSAQHLTANETPIDEIDVDAFCPNTMYLDGLLHTTANRYVLA